MSSDSNYDRELENQLFSRLTSTQVPPKRPRLSHSPSANSASEIFSDSNPFLTNFKLVLQELVAIERDTNAESNDEDEYSSSGSESDSECNVDFEHLVQTGAAKGTPKYQEVCYNISYEEDEASSTTTPPIPSPVIQLRRTGAMPDFRHLTSTQMHLIENALLKYEWRTYISDCKKWVVQTRMPFGGLGGTSEIKVMENIGQGAFGKVWKLNVNEQEFALKLIDLNQLVSIEPIQSVFERESSMNLLHTEQYLQNIWLQHLVKFLDKDNSGIKNLLMAAFTIGNKQLNTSVPNFVEELQTVIPSQSTDTIRTCANILDKLYQKFEAGLNGVYGYEAANVLEFLNDVKAILNCRKHTNLDTLQAVVRDWESDNRMFSFDDFDAELVSWYRSKGYDDFAGGNTTLNTPHCSFLVNGPQCAYLGIVTTYEDMDLAHYIKMLQTTIAAPTLTITRYSITNVVQDLASQLASLHAVGFMHRDVKPSNVLGKILESTGTYHMWREGKYEKCFSVTPCFQSALADFSLARPITPRQSSSGRDDIHSDKTYRQSYISLTEDRGDSFYMAPEAFSSNYSEKVDLFSLGVLFYEMLLLCCPISHNTADRRQCLQKLRDRLEKNLHPLTKSYRRFFHLESAMLDKLLASDPAQRPSASEAAKMLDDVVNELCMQIPSTAADDMWLCCNQFRRMTLLLDEDSVCSNPVEYLALMLHPNQLLIALERRLKELEDRCRMPAMSADMNKADALEAEVDSIMLLIKTLKPCHYNLCL